jgi:hypothetical protein
MFHCIVAVGGKDSATLSSVEVGNSCLTPVSLYVQENGVQHNMSNLKGHANETDFSIFL